MNERPTPECNREQFHRDNGHAREHAIVVSVDFARRLERQRDGLLEALQRFVELDLSGTDDSLVRFIVLTHQNNAEHAIAAVKEGKP